MNILNSLKGAFALLRKEPKVFIPRFTTTLLYTLYTIYSVMLTADLYLNQSDPAYLESNAGRIILLVVSSIVLFLIDIVSYAMYPKIVEDHKRGGKISLSEALSSALGIWRIVGALAILIFVLLFLAEILIGMSLFYFMATGSKIPVLLSVLIVLALIIIFGILVFSVVPVAVLEKKGAYESFRKSIAMGLKHKKELFQVNIFFILLVLPTTILISLTALKGEFSYPAAIAFAIVRFLQAMVYTYVSVSNPYIYMDLPEVNKSTPE